MLKFRKLQSQWFPAEIQNQTEAHPSRMIHISNWYDFVTNAKREKGTRNTGQTIDRSKEWMKGKEDTQSIPDLR